MMWLKSAFSIASRIRGHRDFCSKRLLRTAFQPSRDFSGEKYDYDVIIVGGGMVGGAMACALGKSTYMEEKKMLLLEAGPPPSTDVLVKYPEYHSNRVCAISPGNVKFLESLNIWNKIPRSTPVKKMQVWDACSDAVITFNKNNMDDDLARITENCMIVAASAQVLQTELADVIEVQYNNKIKSVTLPAQNSTTDSASDCRTLVELHDGTLLKTNLLIAADGANSFAVKQSGIKLIKWNYDQSAVVATLKLSEPTNNIVAWQRFLPTGPIALLPLTDVTSSLVWSTTHQQAEDLVEMEESEFVSQINSVFWQNYPQNELVGKAMDVFQSLLPSSNTVLQYPPSISGIAGKPGKFPLGFSHTNEYVKQGFAVIGDACHRIHPLAGQAVNLGFRDVSCLARNLNNSVYNGDCFGSLRHLLEYESERQRSNLPIAGTVDILNRLYSTDNPIVVALRSSGLMLTDAFDPVKNFLMEEAIK